MVDNQTPPAATDYSGVREYIGARYVPVFANPAEWDSTRGYEPLTIVLYQGNSYTSTQYVPTGIDINNTQFWLNTGNYNAQVEAYRQEVLAFDGRITAIEDELAEQSHLIVLGDSWGNPNTSWYSGWVEKLGNLLNCIPHNYCNGGASISSISTNPSLSIYQQAQTAYSECKDLKVKYVIVVGGTNDFTIAGFTGQMYVEGLTRLYGYLNTYFPDAFIRHYQNLCLMRDGSSAQTQNSVRFKNFMGSYRTVQNGVNYYGYLSYDLLLASYIPNFFGEDNLHPASNFGGYIANMIYQSLMGNFSSAGSGGVQGNMQYRQGGKMDINLIGQAISTGAYGEFSPVSIYLETAMALSLAPNSGVNAVMFSYASAQLVPVNMYYDAEANKVKMITSSANITNSNFHWSACL